MLDINFFISLAPCGGKASLVFSFCQSLDVLRTVRASACKDIAVLRPPEVVFSLIIQFAIERIYGYNRNDSHRVMWS